MDENITGMDVAVGAVGSEGERRSPSLPTAQNDGAVAALAPGQWWSLSRKREAVLRLMQDWSRTDYWQLQEYEFERFDEERLQVGSLGPDRRPGALHEEGLQPWGALAELGGSSLARTLVIFLGQRPAHETRCADVGKRAMSKPIAATMTAAESSLTPGMVVSRAMAWRKGSKRSPTSSSIWAIPASIASVCARWMRSSRRW